MIQTTLRHAFVAVIAACTALVAGCGGGGGGGDNPEAARGATTPVTELPAGGGWSGAIPVAPTPPPPIPTLTVRARGVLAEGVGPLMEVRVNDVTIDTVEVRSVETTDYTFTAGNLHSGGKVELVFTMSHQNQRVNLAYVHDGDRIVLPYSSGVIFDAGKGRFAFDNSKTTAGQSLIHQNGALRIHWPDNGSTKDGSSLAQEYAASRFLQQSTFGPTSAEIKRVARIGYMAWLDEQIALPHTSEFTDYIQSIYDKGDAFRPTGANFTAHAAVRQKFWATAATAPDQLRKRAAFALHHILMISQKDSNLDTHSRAYANYLDTLNKYAFGNYRELLEEIALSPAMGIYLSHMRNRPEDEATGRVPDENFAREIMQLFTIGLHELKVDGTPKLNSKGEPIETYTNSDVMAMAKVFTGWSWAFPDSELTIHTFRYKRPDYSAANDRRIDLQRMKAYPGQHSISEKRLFEGKPWAVTIPAGATADQSLQLALDALFSHPNVGPFICRQLIQRLVTSNPSNAYVGRVAEVFNDNGQGVRGDLAAVFKAILLDIEARTDASSATVKLREPTLRITHWMRAFNATSATGSFRMGNANEFALLGQNPLLAESVFGYFRPRYAPPNTVLATAGLVAPEFQVVDESTVLSWINQVDSMIYDGMGWTGSERDVTANLAAQVALVEKRDISGLLHSIDLLLFAGRMSSELRTDVLDAIGGIDGHSSFHQLRRVRIALLVAMTSPEYLVER